MSDLSEHRKTRKRFELRQQARFLTFSCYRRLPLFGTEAIKDAFVEQIDIARSRTQFGLLAYVVMPEHVHLLVQPKLPGFPVAKVLRQMKGPFSRLVLERWREKEAGILDRLADAQGRQHFWQVGGGYDRNVCSDEERVEATAYIHGNPVKRGLVHREADWRWSSARWYAGERDGLTAIDPLPSGGG